MAVQYVRDDDARRLTFFAKGELTIDEWETVVTRQLREGCWHYSVLFDAREMTSLPTEREVRQMVKFVRSLLPHGEHRGPVALVVPDISLHGLGRICALIMTSEFSSPYRPCRRLDEAEQWLAVQMLV